jgi:TonB family protein
MGSKDERGFSPEPFVGAPTYCFEPEKPILRLSSSAGAMAEYNDIVTMRDKYLVRNLVFAFGGRTIMSATVKEITDLSPSDPALVPAVTAKAVAYELLATWAPQMVRDSGTLAKKVLPIYPPKAKELGKSGTVLLQARIGIDGKISNEQVVVGVSPLLNDSALTAVSQWVYKPYLVNGQPVEIETLIRVFYSLGR